MKMKPERSVMVNDDLNLTTVQGIAIIVALGEQLQAIGEVLTSLYDILKQFGPDFAPNAMQTMSEYIVDEDEEIDEEDEFERKGSAVAEFWERINSYVAPYFSNPSNAKELGPYSNIQAFMEKLHMILQIDSSKGDLHGILLSHPFFDETSEEAAQLGQNALNELAINESKNLTNYTNYGNEAMQPEFMWRQPPNEPTAPNQTTNNIQVNTVVVQQSANQPDNHEVSTKKEIFKQEPEQELSYIPSDDTDYPPEPEEPDYSNIDPNSLK